MIEGQAQDHGQFERNGLNQSQRQSQERGYLMIEGANRGLGLWLGWMRGLDEDRVCGMVEGENFGLCLWCSGMRGLGKDHGRWMIECQDQSQWEGLHSGRRERTGGNASASQRQG